MDQEDVIKIFRDLPSTTQMKIRRSRTVPDQTQVTQKTEKRKESVENNSAQEPVPLPKPPESKKRSSLRNKVQPVKQVLQEDKPDKPEIQQDKPVKQEMQDGKTIKQEIQVGKPVREEVQYKALSAVAGTSSSELPKSTLEKRFCSHSRVHFK